MIAPFNKGEIPFVRILLPLAIGIALGMVVRSEKLDWIAAIMLALCSCIAVAALAMYARIKLYNKKWAFGILLHLFIATAGYSISVKRSQATEATHFSRSTYDELVVRTISEASHTGDNYRFLVTVEQGCRNRKFTAVRGNLMITLKITGNAVLPPVYGERMIVPARYSEVNGPLNPGEFNFKGYLANQAVYHQLFIAPDQMIKLTRPEKGVVAFSLRLRQRLVSAFNKHIRDKEAAAVASTLILGYRADLSTEVLSAYSQTGTMHVLSVSGMHVGMVFIVLVFLLRFMERSKMLRLLRALLIILLIWFYSIMSGFSSSVCRAALMLSIVVIGKALNRQTNSYNLIAASGVFLLLYDPFYLRDVGCQLSYLAVLGLIYLYPKLYHALYFSNWFLDKMWGYVALSIAAQAATTPLSIYYFHQFPVCFLLSNLFILIPVTVIMYAGIAFVLLPFDGIQHVLGLVLEKAIQLNNGGLFFIQKLPVANVNGIWITMSINLLLYGLILSVVFAATWKKRKWLYSALGLFFVILILLSHKNIDRDNQQKIVFYSIRKHAAIGFFDRQSGAVYTDLDPLGKTFLFSIKPGLDSMDIDNPTIVSPDQNFKNAVLYARDGFIQFKNWKLLVWNTRFNKKIITQPIAVDVVILQNGPKITISALKKYVRFNRLIADGTNSDYKIRRWQEEAVLLGCDLHILKNNPAIVLTL